MDQENKASFMNFFTKIKVMLFIKLFQDNFFNTMNLRHFALLLLLLFTEYRSCILYLRKRFSSSPGILEIYMI